MKIRLWVYSFLAFGLTLAAFFTLSLHSEFFEVTDVRIDLSSETAFSEGLSKPLAIELRQNLQGDMSGFAHMKIWSFDLPGLTRKILANPWVKSVRVSRIFPNRIQAVITPQALAFLLISSQGKLVPVSENARLLTSQMASNLPDVPILRGEGLVENEKLRQSAIDFLHQLPNDGPLARKNVAEVLYTPDDGFSILLMTSKIEVKLGEDHLTQKIERVTKVLDYLETNHLRGRVIDASFVKKVLVRLRKDS